MNWSGVRARYWLLLFVFFAASFLFLQKVADYSLVRVNLSQSHSTNFRIYWTTEHDGRWTESKSNAIYTNSRKQHFILRLPVPLSEIRTVRIDPSSRPGVTTIIEGISFHHLYTDKVSFAGKGAFSKFVPNEHVSKLEIGRTLKFTSSGNDAWFTVDYQQPESQPMPWLQLAQAAMLGLFLFGLSRYSPWLLEDLKWVPAGLLIAASAAMSMATVTDRNTHPDEHIHLINAGYYAEHYTPPEACADNTKHTYSVYGVSRLNNREIAYYAGGRYLQLVDFIPAPDYLKLRFLNVGLFFILVLLAFRHTAARMLLLPLLLTPQAWYLFSYYNSDALSLFAIVLAAYQLFVPQSILRRLLNGERPPGFLLGVLGLSVLVAMQYWLKLNFVFYSIFLAMLAVSWWLVRRRLPLLRHTMPLLFAFVLGTSLFLSWEISRHAANDFAMTEKVSACQEEMAKPMYKPSTPLEDTHYNVRLREKGHSLYDTIIGRDWPERIFYTALGAYGYTEYLNANSIFEIASFFIALLALYTFVIISIRGDGVARLAVLSTLAAMFGLALAAVWMNWTRDFQPQGRYLIVYLPLLGSLMAMYANLLNRAIISVLAAIPFMLAVYSFFAIGLVEISKS